MDMPRWTVAELVTRYELEPSLNDVFVEGQFDKDILTCAYEHTPKEKRHIYTADVVNIDQDLLEKHSLTSGNKQRLIVLCRELHEVNNDGKIRFIVDKDTDHWFGDLEERNGLLWTEFCDIETYFFEEPFVNDLVMNAGRSKIIFWDKFFSSFKKALKYLYSIRVAERELDLNLSPLDFDRFLTIKADKIEFDLDTYITRLLHKNGAYKHKDNFSARIEHWFNNFNGDPRLFCRGHDFVILIAWSILKFNGVKALSDEVISRTLVILTPRNLKDISNLL